MELVSSDRILSQFQFLMEDFIKILTIKKIKRFNFNIVKLHTTKQVSGRMIFATFSTFVFSKFRENTPLSILS